MFLILNLLMWPSKWWSFKVNVEKYEGQNQKAVLSTDENDAELVVVLVKCLLIKTWKMWRCLESEPEMAPQFFLKVSNYLQNNVVTFSAKIYVRNILS